MKRNRVMNQVKHGEADTASNKRMWLLYLVVGLLVLLATALISGQKDLKTTEQYFRQTMDFIKKQSVV